MIEIVDLGDLKTFLRFIWRKIDYLIYCWKNKELSVNLRSANSIFSFRSIVQFSDSFLEFLDFLFAIFGPFVLELCLEFFLLFLAHFLFLDSDSIFFMNINQFWGCISIWCWLNLLLLLVVFVIIYLNLLQRMFAFNLNVLSFKQKIPLVLKFLDVSPHKVLIPKLLIVFLNWSMKKLFIISKVIPGKSMSTQLRIDKVRDYCHFYKCCESLSTTSLKINSSTLLKDFLFYSFLLFLRFALFS